MRCSCAPSCKACAASDSSSRAVSTTKGTRGAAAWARHTAPSPCASGNPRSSKNNVDRVLRKMLLGLTHARHVRQFDVARALLVEHLAQQTGVSGVIFDQEQQRDRLLAHPLCLCGNLTFVSQKSLMLFTRLANSSNCTGLQW